MKFQNKDNGYIEETSLTFLWVLFFGVFYFLYKKIWNHALISLGLAIITAGISWLIYPFFGKEIVRKHFLRNGWVEVSDTGEQIDSNIEVKNKTGDYVIIAIIIILALAIAGQMMG
ncbi:DUF2628 domain-containing protein [Candidatus Thioglobus autotrophicus]|uniref:DUF2628 domain-containing protein n=1 Tax=Candidatus Thioglobus autotrophicus TaxID=1705394 RepID=UPI0006B4A984|nr:hypothetical protein [Candidatus Thioglobus autotrophicus]